MNLIIIIQVYYRTFSVEYGVCRIYSSFTKSYKTTPLNYCLKEKRLQRFLIMLTNFNQSMKVIRIILVQCDILSDKCIAFSIYIKQFTKYEPGMQFKRCEQLSNHSAVVFYEEKQQALGSLYSLTDEKKKATDSWRNLKTNRAENWT